VNFGIWDVPGSARTHTGPVPQQPHSLDASRVEDLRDGDRKIGFQNRRCRFAATEVAGFDIYIIVQTKDGYRFGLRVDDPILRDFSLGIIIALINQIPFRLVLANNLQGQVGGEWVMNVDFDVMNMDYDKRGSFDDVFGHENVPHSRISGARQQVQAVAAGIVRNCG
jgi:hypothetical protein